MIIPGQQGTRRVRVPDLPPATTEHIVLGCDGISRPAAAVARRARFALSAGPNSYQRAADQARELMDLLLPELAATDSLVDWAAVTTGEFTALAVQAGAVGKLACELRLDGEHLYVSVEFEGAEGVQGPRTGGLVDMISCVAGAYEGERGGRVLWAAAEVVPAETTAA